MLEEQKKLIQERHRLEQAQMRDRAEGAQGKNKAAHTRGRDIGESVSAGCHDEP